MADTPTEATVPGLADWDPNTAGRPDPNVANPTARHTLDHDGDTLVAGFYSAPPGGGEDVWQVHDRAGKLLITVVADRIADAIAEHAQRAGQLRAQAQRLIDRADALDAERALVETLATQEGVDPQAVTVQPAEPAGPAHPQGTVR